MRKVMRNVILIAALCAGVPLAAQDQPAEKPDKPQAPALEKPGRAAPEAGEKKPAAPKKPVEGANAKTVEEIIARVNNEIITRSELDKARVSAEDDAKQECQGKCTPEQLKSDIEDRQKNTLRDLIDQSLLLQPAKDMGVNAKPQLIKNLAQIPTQNKIH